MRRLFLVALVSALVLPASAHATFPGANGRIAFERGGDIWTMNPDGTDQVNLTNTAATEIDPNWSPDGSKIIFKDGTLGFHVMNADGSGVSELARPAPSIDPGWSPDGTKFVFSSQTQSIDAALVANPGPSWHIGKEGPSGDSTNVEPDWSPDGENIAWQVYCDGDFGGGLGSTYIAMAPAEGGGPVQRVTSATECPVFEDLPYVDGEPSWSPDAQRILFTRFPVEGPGEFGLFSIKPDGTGKTLITTAGSDFAVWSPDGSKIAYTDGGIGVMNADGTGRTVVAPGSRPDWQPIPINAYPRPKGASPMQVSLVPAYNACTSSNTTHGAPLAFPSCTPPAQSSAYLTAGTPDANGRPVRMNAALKLQVLTGDVRITAHLNDVANQDLTDYTGSLRAQLPVRITDKWNTPHPGGPGAATTQPFVYGFTIPCVANAGTTTGSDCDIATTMNALAPGTHADGRRAVWQLGQVRVFDGGADADGSTTADNTPFAVQGVFIP